MTDLAGDKPKIPSTKDLNIDAGKEKAPKVTAGPAPGQKSRATGRRTRDLGANPHTCG